ncbi:MAG: glycerol-3-phosphate dehydrogenase, partial [Pseudomonadota bacterium]
PDTPYDLVIIGGGINGCGIARDATGRGLRVLLVEKDDLAQATSSASTKLFHGGLRYLEYYEFRLVREALLEREVLLRNMPHISWPMRFVLPHHKGLRPAWLVRLGLFIYDHLGGRKILPASRSLSLAKHATGKALRDEFTRGFEYSDCWVEDSRLVALNARDAVERGADVRTRTKLTGATREGDVWNIDLENTETGAQQSVTARGIVNAGGPWVADIMNGKLRQNSSEKVRLVRGSHIVTRKLFDHDQPYIFQQADGRIIFAIPYETDYTLLGTTDADHDGAPGTAVCTPEEQDYLLKAASEYFKVPVTDQDVVWKYSGVRPLYDDGASSATAATRDYVLSVSDANGTAPLLNVFGGKITTYRRLAESALEKLSPYYPEISATWTSRAPMPGGDFPVDGVQDLVVQLKAVFPFVTDAWALRLVRAYGTEATEVLDGALAIEDIGQDFGATLCEAEVRWLMDHEFARTAADVVWRRSKLGLRMSETQIAELDTWMTARRLATAAA